MSTATTRPTPNESRAPPNECKDSVLVTEGKLGTGIIFKNRFLITNANLWHKFVIRGYGNLPRNTLLATVLDYVYPHDLIPVVFNHDKKNKEASFLARNCGPAIQKLCQDNLTVPNPTNPNLPLKLTIILKYSTISDFTVNVQKNMILVLNKRYNPETRSLDLESFHQHKSLEEFCPLSQPKILYFVLHLSKSLNPPPQIILLAHNKIKSLKALDVLNKYPCPLTLHLNDNLIASVEDLRPLQSLDIQEITLYNNPFCQGVKFDVYSVAVKQICKSLRKLNGKTVVENFPAQVKNFLCCPNQVEFVSNFLEKFFTLYDSANRKLLSETYHENSFFSLNAKYIPGQVTSITSNLAPYLFNSRNITTMADVSKINDLLYQGNNRIMQIFDVLPRTEHDALSFMVDVTYFTDNCAVIGVNGVFREPSVKLSDPDKCFGFKRTFVLETINADGRTYIMNDMLHVHNASSAQTVKAFKIKKPSTNVATITLTEQDRLEIIENFKLVTNLNTDWSKKCLEESKFNIKQALNLFISLHKQDKIPRAAFMNNKISFTIHSK